MCHCSGVKVPYFTKATSLIIFALVMKYSFARNKYKAELLVDCFSMRATQNITQPTDRFMITFYEIIFITEGKGQFTVHDEVIPFAKGTVLLLPPNKWRRWSQIDEPFDALYLIFEEEHISAFFNDALYLYRLHYFYNTETPSYLQLTEGQLATCVEKLGEIQHEIKNLQPDSTHLLRALLYYQLINLNRWYAQQYQLNEMLYKETEVLRFKQLLEQHIGQKQRVHEYAAMLGVSPSHLNKLLKRYFNKSSSALIKERLIIEIKRQLLFTDLSITEISHALGFSDPSNFNRFFLQQAQLTPKEYRLQNDHY